MTSCFGLGKSTCYSPNVDDDDGANCGGAAVVAAATADGLRQAEATAV